MKRMLRKNHFSCKHTLPCQVEQSYMYLRAAKLVADLVAFRFPEHKVIQCHKIKQMAIFSVLSTFPDKNYRILCLR